jgi:hypothetical protein
MNNARYEALAQFLDVFLEDGNGHIAITRANRSDSPVNNKVWSSLGNYFFEVIDGDLDLPHQVLSDQPDHEYYFVPAIFNRPSRKEMHFAQSNALWVDFDEAVDWNALEPVPSIVVQTSESGKVHCYWLMKNPITDVSDIRYWNHRLIHAFGNGADTSGYDAGQLLKLPWGRNLKLANRDENGDYFEPVVIKFDPELKYTEIAFADLPEPPAPAKIIDLSEIGEVPEREQSWSDYGRAYIAIPTLRLKLMEQQDGGAEGRSGALYNLICECLSAKLSVEQVFQVLCESPNDKWTDDYGAKGAERLWEDINRVSTKLQREKASETCSSGITEIMASKLSFRDKGLKVNEYIIAKLRDTGKFIQSEEGEFYYVDTRGEIPKLYNANVTSTSPLAGLITSRFGLNAGVDRAIFSGVLHSVVYECGTSKPYPFHDFTYYDVYNNRVYVDKYDGTMYMLDGDTVIHVPHGHHGVYFNHQEKAEFPKTFTYSKTFKNGGLDALIFTGPNYTTQGLDISKKQLKILLLTWVVTFFFPKMMTTKPIILIQGEADSGKSTFFQNLSVMFSGDETYAVQPMPKDTRDFNVQVSKNPYIFYDNVEVNTKDMQEKLAQVATGYSIRDRKLNTNSEIHYMKSRAFLGITSRTLNKIQKDVAQRYIVIPVHPYSLKGNAPRQALSKILLEVFNARDDLWSELLTLVNSVVTRIGKHGLEQTGSKLRMADYGAFLKIMAELKGMNHESLENFVKKMQFVTMQENDIMFETLKKLMDKDPYTFHSATDLYKALVKINHKVGIKYTSARQLSQAIKAYIEGGQMAYAGIAVETKTNGPALKYRFFDAEL